MAVIRQISKELVTALTVLALVFLSFVYPPSNANFDAVAVEAGQVSVLSFCGDGPANGEHSAHGPCHACRSSIADLPPPPCEAVSAYLHLVAFTFAVESDVATVADFTDVYNPRAPPVFV